MATSNSSGQKQRNKTSKKKIRRKQKIKLTDTSENHVSDCDPKTKQQNRNIIIVHER